MKIFVCVVLALAAVSAAPAEESNRDKRGIFGEPGGLFTPTIHHDPLLGTHAHLDSHIHAPLHSSILHAPIHAHFDSHLHAPLHSSFLHAPLHGHLHLDSVHHTPILHSHSHIDTPILHGSHIDTLHTDVHHSAPLFHHAPAFHSGSLLHSAPLLHRARAPLVVHKSVHHAPAHHVIRHGW